MQKTGELDKDKREDSDDGMVIHSERDDGGDVGEMGKRKGLNIPESLMS